MKGGFSFFGEGDEVHREVMVRHRKRTNQEVDLEEEVQVAHRNKKTNSEPI